MFYISIIGWELINAPEERDLRVKITDKFHLLSIKEIFGAHYPKEQI